MATLPYIRWDVTLELGLFGLGLEQVCVFAGCNAMKTWPLWVA